MSVSHCGGFTADPPREARGRGRLSRGPICVPLGNRSEKLAGTGLQPAARGKWPLQGRSCEAVRRMARTCLKHHDKRRTRVCPRVAGLRPQRTSGSPTPESCPARCRGPRHRALQDAKLPTEKVHAHQKPRNRHRLREGPQEVRAAPPTYAYVTPPAEKRRLLEFALVAQAPHQSEPRDLSHVAASRKRLFRLPLAAPPKAAEGRWRHHPPTHAKVFSREPRSQSSRRSDTSRRHAADRTL